MGSDPSWADVWYFEGTAGQRVQIDLRSRDFDSYLQLLDAAGNVLADNDDGAGGKDSRITATLRTSQRYQVVANTYGDSPRAGTYTLLVTILPAGR
jgi:serine protease Do